VKLLEYQAKEVFKQYGIPTPESYLAKTASEVSDIAKKLGSCVIKVQLPIGGRGKAGGILFADTPEEAEIQAAKLLGSKLKNMLIYEVLVEEKLDILDEIYLGVVVDRVKKAHIILASSKGGVNIEDVADKTPEKIVKHQVDPILGIKRYHTLWITKQLGLGSKKAGALSGLIEKLYKLALEMDAELTEINPLAYTSEGFIAADGRLNIDDNALFRHKEYGENMGHEAEFSTREQEAKEKGLTYVELDGNIGIISNGAGLTMATIDTVTLEGGKPANFLDLGGGANPERIERSVSFVMSDPRVKVLLVNILGGITRCDDTAKGIIRAREKLDTSKPIVVRMMGTNEEEGIRLLKEAGIDTLNSMDEAAGKAVKLTEALI